MTTATTPRWADDTDFREAKITKVSTSGHGWDVTFDDGWSFLIPEESPVTPAEGMTARLYGKGIGYGVRGVLLDGAEVYYRTETEQQDHVDTLAYGASAQEMLDRWDAGRGIWSVEMGGMSPGYEQAIQITGMEIIRIMLREGTDIAAWAEDRARSEREAKAISDELAPVSSRLGLSGAQWGAAMNLATVIVRNGPVKALRMVSSERRQQQCRRFPTLSEVLERPEWEMVKTLWSVAINGVEDIDNLVEVAGVTVEEALAFEKRLGLAPPQGEAEAAP